MMRSPLAITGCTLLTPLDGVRASDDRPLDTWEAIRRGRRVEGPRSAVAGEFLAGPPAWDRSIRLACCAAQRVISQPPSSQETALFCGTSKGPAGTLLGLLESLTPDEMPTLEAAQQVMLGVGAMGAILGDYLGIRRVHTSVAACASGVFALHQAAQAIWRGEIARAVVIAADASLHPLFEGSFARLGVLAPLDEDGNRRCDPFAEEGRGFFLSEAAAAVVLEAEPTNAPLGFLESTWLGGDGAHLIAADPRADSLRRGLAASIADANPAFIHAHAPGTAHDAHELAAIRAVAGDAPHVFSSKRYLGHSLGAAGLVSVALSALCHHHRQTLAGEPIPDRSTSLTIAQGFGGHLGIVRLRSA